MSEYGPGGQEPCLCTTDRDSATSPECRVWSPVGGSDLSEKVPIEKTEAVDTSWSDRDALENTCPQDLNT